MAFMDRRHCSDGQELPLPSSAGMFPAGRSRDVLGVCRVAHLRALVYGDRTMFDLGSVFQQVFAEISDLVVNHIIALITGLFSGLLG